MKTLRIAIAAALLSLGLSGCDGSGGSAADTKPVDGHDGQVCPKRLPQASVATHGFGTSEPATSTPGLKSPESAWVCVYEAYDRESGQDENGAFIRWILSKGPVRVTKARLSTLEGHLSEMTLPDARRACHSDLGPRFALVYSHGRDLTGVVIDDYGCNDVRMTDEPFTTVPGEATRTGTVSGVLGAPAGLLRELKTIARPATAQKSS